ncbi:esterase [Aliidongia dinghuensis]|uniref:Esterase n=2 Tax=Aliidongia dinghuensis TaxID=1867774 RepID=A0A8J2YR75_9PROT|nr:esterase [Aliidongia dinghuensis]
MTTPEAAPMGVPLAGFGSFYAGGRQVRIEGQPVRRIQFTPTVDFDWDPNGLFHIEQAYVQWFVPADRRHALPVVLLHGGGYTGTMWEATPDGRPGWLMDFLAMGHPVYVVDNVERGRAGWCPFPELWPGPPILRSAEEAWSLFRIGAAPDFMARRPFPRQRFPTAAFDEMIRGSVPRFPRQTDDAAVAALGAVLARIGRPVALVAHSQGGEIAQRAALTAPEQIAALVLLEASGFPAAADAVRWRVLQVVGDHLDATPLWRDLAGRYRNFAADLTRHGVRSDAWFLAERGVAGNSHMLMMDDNSAELAREVAGWLHTI